MHLGPIREFPNSSTLRPHCDTTLKGDTSSRIACIRRRRIVATLSVQEDSGLLPSTTQSTILAGLLTLLLTLRREALAFSGTFREA